MAKLTGTIRTPGESDHRLGKSRTDETFSYFGTHLHKLLRYSIGHPAGVQSAKLGHELIQDLPVGFLEFGGRLWCGFVRLLVGLNECAQQAKSGSIAAAAFATT